MTKLTFQQECDICYVIGSWYVKWKDRMCNYENKTHNLGVAKEDLKNMIITQLGESNDDKTAEEILREDALMDLMTR